MKRFKLPVRKSKRNFTRNALKTDTANINPRPMRGGIRL